MAVRQASWIQASSHPADTDRLILESLFRLQGVVNAGDLAVTQNGTPNMSVNVASGAVVIDGTESSTQGFYHMVNDATLNVAIAAAHATLPRIDLIVAKIQDAQYSGATNAGSIVAVTGTAAASPVAPAAPANSVILAQIAVAALATSITNANITDRRTFAGSPPSCRVYHNTTQSHAVNGNWQAVVYNSESYDPSNMHDTASNTSRIVVPRTGLYLATATVSFAANGTGARGVRFNVNGVPSNTQGARTLWQPNGGVETSGSLSAVMRLLANDYVEVNAYQSSGAALNMTNAEGDPHFSLTWLGAA